MILSKLAGPLTGALIGYCTNYIAVKMLFYPKKEIRIFGHKLPFTPGAIPKGKTRLANAIGNIVANTLLTEDDIKKKIMSPETENAVMDKMTGVLSTDLHTCIGKVCQSEETYGNIKDKITDQLTDQILDSVQRMNLETIIVQEAGKAVKEKTKGTMIAMFLNDDMMNSLIQPVGGEIVKYINENGRDYVKTEISTKLSSLEEKSVLDLCGALDISEDKVHGIVDSLYHTAIDSVVGSFIGSIDIAGIIEEKINEMNVDDLEDMVLTIMKKELNTIVNLGALVGGLLGILNMLF